MTDTNIQSAIKEGPAGPAPVLILCEHASRAIPAEFGDLGLDEAARASHIAWDPGALDLSRRLSNSLGAPLVAGTVSRLLYDCNRAPEAPDAVPGASETYEIPGNLALDDSGRAARAERIYRPFCAAVSAALDESGAQALVTVHSFTPVYFGRPREVEIGILHDSDTRLADAVLARLDGCGLNVQRNAPYGPEDRVTHSLQAHALPRGLLNVMIEVRNDLLAAPGGAGRIGALLGGALQDALVTAGVLPERAG